MIPDTRAVTLTPVAPAILGIMGIRAGPTTPRVLEKKLMQPATSAITSLAAVALKLSPIQEENISTAPAWVATDTSIPTPQTNIMAVSYTHLEVYKRQG